jgi:HK97 family phage portal protein
MGWLTGPKVAKDSLAVIDGRQSFMALPPGTAAGGPNLAGEIQPDGSYANYATSGYGRNDLVYACIRYRAESLPQSVVRVYDALSNDAIPLNDHRLRKLFERPNPITSEFEFFEMLVTYKDLAGTCYILVVKGRDGLPAELWPLRPDLVGVSPNPRDLADFDWVYRPDPERPEIAVAVPDAGSPRAAAEPAYMIRIRYPNPNPNDIGWRYFGQPPLRPAARATSLDNGATDFVDTLLRNHAMPAVVVETEQEITDTLHKRLMARWKEAFGGTRRGGAAFLQKGMKLHEVTMTLKDLEFPDLRTQTEVEICRAFGVEPVLVGAKVGLENNAYKDYREARLSFWEEAMFSEQRRFIEPIRSFLVPAFTGVGRRPIRSDWDNSGVLALRESQGSLWERSNEALKSGGITRNDFRRLVGLPPVPGGDVFLTPLNVATQEIPSESAETISSSLDLLAAEYGIELRPDEITKLRARRDFDHG